MKKDELFSALNSGMIAERGRAFRKNLEKNLPMIAEHGGLAGIVQRISGKHAVVIGAGPSLDANIELLSGISGDSRFVLVAADMALKPLITAGVVPDYVITCETLSPGFFSGIDSERMHLLAFSCSSHSSLRSWKGKISFYNWMIEGDFFSSLWDLAGSTLGYVATGSTVTTQAVAIVMGCGILSLMLLGNDLGFYDRFYASGTARMDRNCLLLDRFVTLTGVEMKTCRNNRQYEIVRDGRTFYTNNQFLAARYWLEDLFAREPFPVADCSFPGCSASIVYKTGLNEYIESINQHTEARI